MNLKQLRARLSAIKGEMQALIDGGLDEEAQVSFDALEAEAKQIQGNIDRLQRFEQLEASDEAPQGRQVKPDAVTRVEVKDNAQDDPTAGFNGIGEFAMAVKQAVRGNVDNRLNILGAPSNFHRETGSSDGYMVPTEYKDKIFELVFDQDDLLGMVDSEPTGSNQVQFLSDETTPWGATGIKAYWSAEGDQMTRSRLETTGESLKLHKMHVLVEATEELLEDAPRLNSRLTKGAASAISWKANESILFGDGVGKPLGFDNSASKISVAKESGQAADTIVAKNVAKMYSRVMNPARAVWLVNQDTLPEFLTMTLGDKPIWLAPNGYISAPGGVLFGRPVMFSEYCKTLGDNGDIMLIDPMGYYLAKKASGVKFTSSIHLWFDYDVQAFKWTFRLGGQPYLSAAVSPNNGTSTRSHYVTLAARN